MYSCYPRACVCVCVCISPVIGAVGGRPISSLFSLSRPNCKPSSLLGQQRKGERESKENVEKTSKIVLCTQKYAGTLTNNRTLYIIIIIIYNNNLHDYFHDFITEYILTNFQCCALLSDIFQILIHASQ